MKDTCGTQDDQDRQEVYLHMHMCGYLKKLNKNMLQYKKLKIKKIMKKWRVGLNSTLGGSTYVRSIVLVNNKNWNTPQTVFVILHSKLNNLVSSCYTQASRRIYLYSRLDTCTIINTIKHILTKTWYCFINVISGVGMLDLVEWTLKMKAKKLNLTGPSPFF